MAQNQRREFLDQIRSDEIKAVEQGQCLGAFEQHDRSARTGAELDLFGIPRRRDECYQIVFELIGYGDVGCGALKRNNLLDADARLNAFDRFAFVVDGHDLYFVVD